jgi:hypothetical protein
MSVCVVEARIYLDTMLKNAAPLLAAKEEVHLPQSTLGT